MAQQTLLQVSKFSLEWDSVKTDFSCSSKKENLEIILNAELEDAYKSSEELIRSIRDDPEEVSSEMARSFLESFQQIKKSLEADLLPMKSTLNYMRKMLSQTTLDQSLELDQLRRTQGSDFILSGQIFLKISFCTFKYLRVHRRYLQANRSIST